MLSFQAVLFDLDGTLVDTAPDFIAILNDLRAENQLPPLNSDIIRKQVSQGASAVIRAGFGHLYTDDSAEFIKLRDDFLNRYEKNTALHSQLFLGMEDILNHLETQNIPWGVVTNKPVRFSEPLLKSLNLAERCAVLICPDHVTHTKPHAEPLLKAAEILKISPEKCIYIGDHHRDIESGKNAGMITIAAGFGYIMDGDDIKHWYADFNVDTVAELQNLLQ